MGSNPVDAVPPFFGDRVVKRSGEAQESRLTTALIALMTAMTVFLGGRSVYMAPAASEFQSDLLTELRQIRKELREDRDSTTRAINGLSARIDERDDQSPRQRTRRPQ